MVGLAAARCAKKDPPSPTPDPCDLTRGGLDFQKDVVPPKKVKDVAPVYPDRRNVKVGEVVVEFMITAEGKTTNVKITKGLEPAYDQAAADAVHQWEYTAARIRGTPCSTLSRVTVRFLAAESPSASPAPARPNP